MKHCIYCNKELIGQQSKYCSKNCKNSVYQNKIRKEYKDKTGFSLQSKKGFERKLLLIQELGGGCQKCGYNKNIAALEFHHIQSNKKFNLDSRAFANYKLDIIKEELKKCILVCSNCHQEIHHPHLQIIN